MAPPALLVRVDDDEIAVLRGSTCWSLTTRSVCALAGSPPDVGRSLSPASVRPRSRVRLTHERPPLGEPEVTLWTRSGPQPVALHGFSIVAPEKPGTYTYAVFARWPQGDTTHVFRIRVNPPQTLRRRRTRFASDLTGRPVAAAIVSRSESRLDG